MHFPPVSKKVSVSLHQKDKPVSAGVDDSGSPSQTICWFAEGCAGNCQYAYKPDSAYTPLYSMR